MEFTFRHEQDKIMRLLAIHLPVMDLTASVIWYTEYLELSLLKQTNSSAELAVLENGITVHPTLVLTRTESSHRLNYEKDGRLRSMVMMHASNLEGIRDKMIHAGVNVTLSHADQEDDGCGRFFEATDPSGNIIQIQANDGESPADHERVEAIFNLEIPVSDVHKSARFYTDVLGFQLIREPDDQLAIVKTGPFYKIRFGYLDVQEFGFFLFRHERSTALHFKNNAGQIRECLVLQANDTAALHEHLTSKGHIIMETEGKTDSGQMSFQIIDPDGNRIKIVPWEESPFKTNIIKQSVQC
ncbi:VOC family protein [Paenibacillus psychroresistens]|nr:VOC family protein [Paenibacillus psychroresistens]